MLKTPSSFTKKKIYTTCEYKIYKVHTSVVENPWPLKMKTFTEKYMYTPVLNYTLKLNMSKELSLEQLLRVLGKIDEGVTYKRIKDEFGVSYGTITNIKQSQEQLLLSITMRSPLLSSSASTSRVRGDAAELDRRLTEWFVRARSNVSPISGPMLKKRRESW